MFMLIIHRIEQKWNRLHSVQQNLISSLAQK